jgi:hypothetical protein
MHRASHRGIVRAVMMSCPQFITDEPNIESKRLLIDYLTAKLLLPEKKVGADRTAISLGRERILFRNMDSHNTRHRAWPIDNL